MVLAKVRDKKTQLERTVTPKAYSIIPNRYVLLGYQDENGNPVDGPTSASNPVARREKKSVAPAEVEDKSGIVEPPRMTREDLDRMNQEAMEKAKQKVEAEKAKQAAPVAVKKAQPKKK